MEIFDEIAAERRGVADTLGQLTDEQWQTDSLCAGWTVHDVGAHLLMPLVTPTVKVVAVMARHRMNFDRANISLTRSVAARSNAEIVEGLRANAISHFTPPGLGPQAPLTDCIVHGQDIRRPLGLAHSIPADRQLAVLDFLTGPKSSGFAPPDRIAGISFTATDLDWAFEGGDATVSGPAEAIMMALAGRAPALADLSGDGVALLAARLPTG